MHDTTRTKPGSHLRFIKPGLVLLFLVLVGALTFAPAGTASAASIQQRGPSQAARAFRPEWCGSESGAVGIDYSNGQYASFFCSGSYTIDANLSSFGSGGWSGYIQLAGWTEEFCNGWTYFLQNQYAYYIYLSPTRESWC